MPNVDEVASEQGGFAALLAGLRVLSLDETIVFTKYIRKVMPLDGYVFWLATEPMPVQGSLHVSADKRQLEDETISVNRAILSTPTEIQPFNTIGPNTLWIGESRGLKFAFSQQGFFYKPSGIWHYAGDAVYPALESQLVELGRELSDRTLIVSNSLPAWLHLIDYDPIWLTVPNPRIMLYPSFLVPANLRPPYGVVHIPPAETRGLSDVPLLGRTASHSQLATDRAHVTLYGTTNEQAAAWYDLVVQFSRDTDAIGLMSTPPILRDEKRAQAELGVLAMKKTIDFEVSYNQAAIRRLARQMIETVTSAYVVNPFPLPISSVGVH